MAIEEAFKLTQRDQMVKLGRTLYGMQGFCSVRVLLKNLRCVELYLDNVVRRRFNEPVVAAEEGYVSVINAYDLEE